MTTFALTAPKNNFAKNAVDGNLSTRWCTAGGGQGQHWKVELAKVEHVQSLRIHWEKAGAVYRYKVDASSDGEKWNNLVDASKNKKKAQVTSHVVDSPDTKFLRVTFLGSTPSFWGSFWEFEAYATKELPKLPKGLKPIPAGGGNTAGISDVKAPDGFNVTLFGTPPDVNYPVCLASAPTGELFVGVDEQGGPFARADEVLRADGRVSEHDFDLHGKSAHHVHVPQRRGPCH